MQFYGFGAAAAPVILLFPGTCCHWNGNFGAVFPLLERDFRVICVSYDGFDETEDTIFSDMLTETEKMVYGMFQKGKAPWFMQKCLERLPASKRTCCKKEEFDTFLKDAMGKAFVILNHLDMNRLEKKRWLTGLVYRYMERCKRQVDQKRGGAWGNTWKVRINPDGHQQGIAYVLDTCPLCEFAQKHGYMDILPCMCASDQLVARQFHAHLIRHLILSDGDDCCEYWFVGNRSPEATEDAGSK